MNRRGFVFCAKPARRRALRHSNVASVFHLGRTGSSYFYAMEFVEGETLENLIKRSGRLEVKLALEIATQVAAGLAAVHEQNLVHRDIKPTNIMVRLKEEGGVTAKIIDLGLAKTLDESASEAGISSPGAFVGTPEFASPEQFAGVGVDIRSDLYSLGVTLWEMVTGQTPFRGPSAEVMYQHQHAPLPLEQLKDVPQPVVVLLEKLLEKDPAQRFQTPNELLKAIPTITGAIDARRRITRQSLQKTPSTASRVGTRKPPARLGTEEDFRSQIARYRKRCFWSRGGYRFSGSMHGQTRMSTSLQSLPGPGSESRRSSTIGSDGWLLNIIVLRSSFLAGPSTDRAPVGALRPQMNFLMRLSLGLEIQIHGSERRGRRAKDWRSSSRIVEPYLVLDGLEPLQNPPGPQEGRLREPSLQALLRELAAFNTGLCVITTRMPVADIADHERTSALRRDLEQLSSDAGAKLLRALGVKGDEAELRSASDEFSGHCLALTLLGSYLTDAYNGDIRCRKEVSARLAHDVRQAPFVEMGLEVSAVTQNQPLKVEIKGFKTSHFLEQKTAPQGHADAGPMGHVERPYSESASHDLQFTRKRLVPPADRPRAWDRSRDRWTVFAVGKTSHFDHRG